MDYTRPTHRPAAPRAQQRPTRLAPVWQQTPVRRAPAKAAAVASPSVATQPPTPVDHQQMVPPKPQQQPLAQPPVSTAHHAPAPVSHHKPVESVHHKPAHYSQPAALAAADAPVLSIKISVPDSESLQDLLAWRPTSRQIIIGLVALFIFTIGYQVGSQHASAKVPQAAFVPSVTAGKA